MRRETLTDQAEGVLALMKAREHWKPARETCGRVDGWVRTECNLAVDINPPMYSCYYLDVPRDKWVVVLRRTDVGPEGTELLAVMDTFERALAFVRQNFRKWEEEDDRFRSLLSELDTAGFRFPLLEETVMITTASDLSLSERLHFGMRQADLGYYPEAEQASPAEIADILHRYGFGIGDSVLALDAIGQFQPLVLDGYGLGEGGVVQMEFHVGLRQGMTGISEAFVPLLPGCLVNASTLGQSLERIQLRVYEVLTDLLSSGRPIPDQLDIHIAKHRVEYQDARFLVLPVEIR